MSGYLKERALFTYSSEKYLYVCHSWLRSSKSYPSRSLSQVSHDM